MIELTEQQHQALNVESAPRAHDPQTNVTYVLVRADVYERMQTIIDGYTRRAGWDDPKMDEYEKFRNKV